MNSLTFIDSPKDVTSNWCNWVRCAGLTEGRLSSFNVVSWRSMYGWTICLLCCFISGYGAWMGMVVHGLVLVFSVCSKYDWDTEEVFVKERCEGNIHVSSTFFSIVEWSMAMCAAMPPSCLFQKWLGKRSHPNMICMYSCQCFTSALRNIKIKWFLCPTTSKRTW